MTTTTTTTIHPKNFQVEFKIRNEEGKLLHDHTHVVERNCQRGRLLITLEHTDGSEEIFDLTHVHKFPNCEYDSSSSSASSSSATRSKHKSKEEQIQVEAAPRHPKKDKSKK